MTLIKLSLAIVTTFAIYTIGLVQHVAAQRDVSVSLPLAEHQADSEIPDSKSALRYDWGDEISSHFQIETYLKTLAEAAPDNTRLVQYGESYEGRSLNYLVISSSQNIARLDEIQSDILKLADPRAIDNQTAESLISSSPAVVWLAYAVHGNEISPSDAALLTAYHLLADERAETESILENLVVVIDPLQNPDGRDRFVNVFRETRGLYSQSDPYANEHTERWPSGRSNHYWFDMNRDWFRHSQQEVKAKVAAYLDWQPQIYVDAHEMGRNSTFYFPPPAEPKNPYLLDRQIEWFEKLGRHQAGWFDKYQFGYMTREVFDAFYPGYGSEWPTLQGGLGVLWEQASARGQIIDRDDDTRLTYKDGVRNHYVSGLATVEFAAENREALLRNFYESKVQAINLGETAEVQDFFLKVDQRPQRAKRLAKMLARNGIEVRVLDESLAVNCRDTANNEEKSRLIPAGSYHVDVAQPTGRLIRALLDRQVDMGDKFLRRQLERNQLRLPDEIYDVTAWSMPLAFDVECLAVAGDEEIQSSQVDLFQEPAGTTDLAEASVAYLLNGTDGAIQAMSHLIQNGVRVHICDEPFKINNKDFERGTLIVKVAGNPDDLNSRLQDVCREYEIEAYPIDSAFVDEGAHMGGPHVHWVKPPRILLVVNQPTNYSSGHTWHLFDQVLAYPTTRIKGENISRIDLDKFDTIVLPDGNYSESNGFGESTARKLSDWASQGGTLITLRGATGWAVGENVSLLGNDVKLRQIESPEGAEDGEDAEKVTPDNVPGAFFRTKVFSRHWVTFGFNPEFDAFYSGRLVLTPTRETAGRSLVTFADRENLLTSGFCWPTSLDLLADSPYVVYRQLGQGHVISFTDDPNFRAMYPALQRLFINAAMFGAAH